MSDPQRLALVTGASRGIGAAVASRLARAGARVVGTATTSAGAESINALAGAQGLALEGQVLDVRDAEAVDRLCATIEDRYGAVGILVNNAAITRDGLLLRMDPDDWDEVLETDLTGVYRLTRRCLRGMVRARWGRIITLTSVVAFSGNPGQANYAAAKAGLVGFTRALALEVGSRQITVNAVAPGFIETDMTRSLDERQREALLGRVPLGRFGRAEEVAALVAYLAGDESGYVTAQTFHINGGMFPS
ncbi:MAG: 3-oxoacyl-ACP reductase FabG [Gammaproteobacteria bacterium]|nr:3-oxoacyl-ACP reductase FabG [Gammaproteobacteria bacterium]